MNCPECGRFMKLISFEQAGKSVWDSYLWWWCFDEEKLHTYETEPIPAHEYQWLWNCEGIPEEAFVEWPELRQECNKMWLRLPISIQRKHLFEPSLHLYQVLN